MKISRLNCPSCGAPIKLSDRDCSHCGSAVIIISSDSLGEKSIKSDLLDASLSKWRDILKANPDDPEANYCLGMIYFNKKMKDAALQHLRKVVLLAPEFALGHYNLALVLFNNGNTVRGSAEEKESQKELEYASNADPQFKEAQGFYHFFMGNKLDKVDLNQAAKEFKIAIEKCPDISTFHNNLGQTYLQLGQYGLALKPLTDAIRIKHDDIAALNGLAHLWYNKEKYDVALGYSEKAIAAIKFSTVDNTKAHIYNQYGLCLWKLKRKKEAIENVKKAIALAPGNPLFINNLTAVSSGCFIATAAMGSESDPIVVELQTFRDQWLAKKRWGDKFIRWYYKYGEVPARLISKHMLLRRLSYYLIVIPVHMFSKQVLKSITHE